jgi:hypothetical protein
MFAAPGPGSRRGLNRVMGRDTNAKWKDAEWLDRHLELMMEVVPILRAAGVPGLCAQNLQNAECEYDKYERARLGEGKPNQLYRYKGDLEDESQKKII